MRVDRHTLGLERIFAGMLVILLAWAALSAAPPPASAASDDIPAASATLAADVSYTGAYAPEETFTIAVAPQDGAPAPTGGTEQSIALSQHTTSGTLQFTFNLENEPTGTFRYAVSEKAGATEGVTYSDKTYVIEFETNLDYGEIKVTPFRVYDTATTYTKPAAIAFDNTYQAKRRVVGDPPVRIEKAISGDTPVTDSDFVFVMEPTDPAFPLPTPASSAVEVRNGKVYVTVSGKGLFEEIGDVAFTAPGEYTYTVRERDDRVPGYTYDDAVFDVIYTVREDSGGNLSCTRTVLKGGTVYTTGDKPLTFNNTYTTPSPDDPTPPVWLDGSAARTTAAAGKVQKASISFKPGSAAIVGAQFIDPATGKVTDATEVDVFDANGNKVGTYRLNPTPVTNADGTVSYEVTFTPVAGYVGTPPPITLRAFDENGLYAEGSYQPVVTSGSAPTPTPASKAASGVQVIAAKTGDAAPFIPLAAIAVVSGIVMVAARRRHQLDD